MLICTNKSHRFCRVFSEKNDEFGKNELFSLMTQDSIRFSPFESLIRKSPLNQMPHIIHMIFVTKTSVPRNPSGLLLLLLLETAVVPLASFHISTTYPRRLMKFLLYQYGDKSPLWTVYFAHCVFFGPKPIQFGAKLLST